MDVQTPFRRLAYVLRNAQQRAIEVAIAVGVLNRMLELGRPESVHIA